MTARWLAIAVAIALYLFALAGPPPEKRVAPARPSAAGSEEPAAPAASRYAVVGYYVEDARNPSLDSMATHAVELTAIAPWAWRIEADGSVQLAASSPALSRAVREAMGRGLAVWGLAHNYREGGFDREAVHRLLSDPQASARSVERLAQEARRWGVSGVVLDLENVPPEDRANLSAFAGRLAQRLHGDGRLLAVAAPARTSDGPESAHFGAYDYQALGRLADAVWLMTYDQHYRTGPPGPVASVEWVERVVRYAVAHIPPRKILLGLPAYGYEWDGEGPARALTHDQAMQRLRSVGASLRWHPVHKVPYFSWGDRWQAWFENRYSAGYKLLLVRRYGLGGVAIWRLGQEDPGLWEVIARYL